MRKLLAVPLAALALLVSANVAQARIADAGPTPASPNAGVTAELGSPACSVSLTSITSVPHSTTVSATGTCGAGYGLHWDVWVGCYYYGQPVWQYQSFNGSSTFTTPNLKAGVTCGWAIDLSPVNPDPGTISGGSYAAGLIGGFTIEGGSTTVQNKLL